MYTRSVLATAALSMLVIQATVSDDNPRLGESISSADLIFVDYTIMPDGEGLPDGSGTAAEGSSVYQQNCLDCHGAGGKDGVSDVLVGGQGTLTTGRPRKTVGSYWPYATTLFDYVRRAMPYQAPGTLTNDETYAVTAYILFLNEIVDEKARMDADTLSGVKMPNRDNFVWDYASD
jgi:mono/diheme cytochrome c family protein